MTISNLRPEKTLCSIFTLLLCSHSATLFAETRYVTDELQLSMYEEINSQGKLLQRLNSGTELELLESKGLYAKVRTQEGVEGWTKAGFLISEKPARAQLIDAQERIEDLEGKLDQSQQQLTATQTDLKKIQNNQGEAYAELTQRLESAEKIAATVDHVKQENETYRARLNSDEGRIPLKWGLIGAAISLLMGIAGGIALFDYRSRRRHGGYRIY
ncbi:MAG: TIGR04211 family SH3 domain-containing protein [Candidatus Thiodiazotropha sp. (ex Monitilora ramsayi)]|nr:TIGR04211 family SH3 domain-containing protein [Candidatus Thiodiazotropha sp. (ex Monitilora ramsayi)]